jgi:hypothetical protein
MCAEAIKDQKQPVRPLFDFLHYLDPDALPLLAMDEEEQEEQPLLPNFADRLAESENPGVYLTRSAQVWLVDEGTSMQSLNQIGMRNNE